MLEREPVIALSAAFDITQVRLMQAEALLTAICDSIDYLGRSQAEATAIEPSNAEGEVVLMHFLLTLPREVTEWLAVWGAEFEDIEEDDPREDDRDEV